MVRNNLDITYTIVWSLALANVIGAGLCILLSKWIAKLTTIRFTLLAPLPLHDHRLRGVPVAPVAGRPRRAGRHRARRHPAAPVRLFAAGLPDRLRAVATSPRSSSTRRSRSPASRFRRGWRRGFDYILSPHHHRHPDPDDPVDLWSASSSPRTSARTSRRRPAPRPAPAIFLGLRHGSMRWSRPLDAWSVSRLQDRIFPLTIGLVTLRGLRRAAVADAAQPSDDDVFIDLEQGEEDGSADYGLWRTLAWFLGAAGAQLRLRAHHRAGPVPASPSSGSRRASAGLRPRSTPRRGIAFICALGGHPRARLSARSSAALHGSSLAPDMTQRPVPFLFLRGGTSRGPYFLRSDLPRTRTRYRGADRRGRRGQSAQHRRPRRRRRR